jgi:hypothetical protein
MNRPPIHRTIVLLGFLLGPLVFSLSAAPLDYKRDIMPIFEAKCFDCHGDGESKGGLKLDDPKAFYKRFAKNNVVVPGDWDGSYLFVAVSRPPGAKDAMPPKKKGDSLTPDEVMKVAKWIYEGARIDGEKGEKGAKDDNPEEFIKFKNGVMVTDSYDHVEEEKVPEKAVEEVPRDWFNAEGQKIVAIYKGIEGDKVILVRKDGKAFKYPIAKLSDKSQGLLKELRAAAEGGEGSAARQD